MLLTLNWGQAERALSRKCNISYTYDDSLLDQQVRGMSELDQKKRPLPNLVRVRGLVLSQVEKSGAYAENFSLIA